MWCLPCEVIIRINERHCGNPQPRPGIQEALCQSADCVVSCFVTTQDSEWGERPSLQAEQPLLHGSPALALLSRGHTGRGSNPVLLSFQMLWTDREPAVSKPTAHLSKVLLIYGEISPTGCDLVPSMCGWEGEGHNIHTDIPCILTYCLAHNTLTFSHIDFVC